ncbi:ABC transporter substrate-binding protein, partial [Gemmatimonadota bacterium]
MRSTTGTSGRGGVRYGLLLFLLLAGCGREPAELRVAVSMIPDQIDPVLSGQLDGRRIAAHLYESLLRQDETGQLQPHLATTWDYDSTFTRLYMQLRPNVLFHDGSTMTAQDVAYSLERILTGAEEPDIRMGTSPYQLGNLLAVNVIGDLELEIEIPWPHHSLLKTLTTPFLTPIIKEGSDRSPAGTGPYRIVEYSSSDGVVVLERNIVYWGSQPGPEQILFRAYEGDAERLEAIEAGEMDIALNVAVTSVEAVIKSDLMDFDLTGQKAWVVLSLNNQRPPFDDVLMRHAFAEVLDTRSIVTEQWQAAGEQMHLFVGPGLDPDLRGPSATVFDSVRAEVLKDRRIGAGAPPLLFLRSPAAKRDKTEKLVTILEVLLGPFGYEIEQQYYQDFE